MIENLIKGLELLRSIGCSEIGAEHGVFYVYPVYGTETRPDLSRDPGVILRLEQWNWHWEQGVGWGHFV